MRLMTYWTSLGVISALEASMAYGVAATTEVRVHSNRWSDEAAVYLGATIDWLVLFALYSSMLCVLCATIYFAQINQLPNDIAVLKFIMEFEEQFKYPTTSFMLCTMSLMMSSTLILILKLGYTSSVPYLAMASYVYMGRLTYKTFRKMNTIGVGMQFQFAAPGRSAEAVLHTLEAAAKLLPPGAEPAYDEFAPVPSAPLAATVERTVDRRGSFLFDTPQRSSTSTSGAQGLLRESAKVHCGNAEGE